MAKNKQEDIFDAAMQLFAERGYDGTTIPMIAEKANVGAGTIYRYFENKEALVNSLFSKSMLQLSEMIKTDFPVEANIREQFSHTYNRLFEFARNNVDAFYLQILTVIVIFLMSRVRKYLTILYASL